MPMRPCEDCLENLWTLHTEREIFEADGYYNKWTVAICLCGREIEFGHKKLSLYHASGKQRLPENIWKKSNLNQPDLFSPKVQPTNTTGNSSRKKSQPISDDRSTGFFTSFPSTASLTATNTANAKES